MQHVDAKDVFISYRREDGATAARLLCDALERRNISTFFDKETIEGDFHQSIRNHLAAARNVLVVVSARMFSRCLLEDGSYDEEASKSDWVYEELRMSLESNKNIIPVFVNGVSGFPAKLPKTIEKIAAFDALNLGHEHFDAELAKLIGRLNTPKNQLLSAYIQTEKELVEDDLIKNLASVCRELSAENEQIIENFLRKTLKSSWESSVLTDRESMEILLDGAWPSYLKRLAKNLGLDDTGGAHRIKGNILAWLNCGGDEKKYRKFDESRSENDRVNDLARACARVFRSVEDRQWLIEKVISKLDVDMDGFKRSSSDAFISIFADVDVEEFFGEMRKTIRQDDVKEICIRLFGEDVGRKSESIDLIVQYVNYEYSPDGDVES